MDFEYIHFPPTIFVPPWESSLNPGSGLLGVRQLG